jgi:hypothetical protein
MVPIICPNIGEEIQISIEKIDKAGIWYDQETWLIYKYEHIHTISVQFVTR